MIATADEVTRLVRTAHADAWEVEGRLRAPFGGGAARVPGARLMASGIAQPKWNNADVTSADVDWDQVHAWYAERGMPWGIRVPLELHVELGSPLFVKRCAVLFPDRFSTPTEPAEVDVRPFTGTAAGFADLDAAIFAADPAESLAWVRPQINTPGFRHWVAEVEGAVVAIATTVRSDSEAGPAAYLTGVAAVPSWAEHILGRLVSVATSDAFTARARFVHANPDDDSMMELLAAHGAVEVPGFQIRVVVT